MVDPKKVRPGDVLDFWFPAGLNDRDRDAVGAFFGHCMHGGMDEAICRDWSAVAEAGSDGALDAWAETPEGRLALLLVLDQFPRSLWRDTPNAFCNDLKSARLALEGIENGHYSAIPEAHRRIFFHIAIGHCEGPEHAERMSRLVELCDEERNRASNGAEEFWQTASDQNRRILGVISRFGRHPHRNAVLGRRSTPDERAYVAEGDFPHVRSPDPEDA